MFVCCALFVRSPRMKEEAVGIYICMNIRMKGPTIFGHLLLQYLSYIVNFSKILFYNYLSFILLTIFLARFPASVLPSGSQHHNLAAELCLFYDWIGRRQRSVSQAANRQRHAHPLGSQGKLSKIKLYSKSQYMVGCLLTQRMKVTANYLQWECHVYSQLISEKNISGPCVSKIFIQNTTGSQKSEPCRFSEWCGGELP